MRPSGTTMRPACGTHAGFDRFGDLVQVHMSGNDLIIGADDADDRTIQFFFSQSQRIKQAAVRSTVHTDFNLI